MVAIHKKPFVIIVAILIMLIALSSCSSPVGSKYDSAEKEQIEERALDILSSQNYRIFELEESYYDSKIERYVVVAISTEGEVRFKAELNAEFQDGSITELFDWKAYKWNGKTWEE